MLDRFLNIKITTPQGEHDKTISVDQAREEFPEIESAIVQPGFLMISAVFGGTEIEVVEVTLNDVATWELIIPGVWRVHGKT